MPVKLDSVSIAFGGRTVVDGVSAYFPPRSRTAIVGPSGAGKSTLLAAIGGYIAPTSGTINRYGISQSQMGFVFQSTNLLLGRTALDNVAVGAMARGRTLVEARRVASDLMLMLSMSKMAKLPVLKLSGGERQRLMVLRVVAFESPIILADEPTASLDRENRDAVVRALEVAAELGATVILSTHDDAVASSCDQVLRLWG